MKKTILAGIAMILAIFLVNASLAVIDNLYSSDVWNGGVDLTIIHRDLINISKHPYANAFEEDYIIELHPDRYGRAFIWNYINFPKISPGDMDKVVVRTVAVDYDFISGISDILLDNETIYDADFLNSGNYPELKYMELHSDINHIVQYHMLVYTVYNSTAQAFAGVWPTVAIASEGTSICGVLKDYYYGLFSNYMARAFGYSSTIISLNFELFQMAFIILEILAFMVFLGVLVYFVLFIVKLIRGNR